MFYLDTSIIGSLFLNEKYSSLVEQWVAAHQSTGFVISPWVRAEVSSMLGLRVRTNRLTNDQANLMYDRITDWLMGACRDEDVGESDFLRAAHFLKQWQLGLRVGDALHLAICERLAVSIVTLDDRLFDTAHRLTIATEHPVRAT